MILINQIITDIRIESVNDLYKLKPFLEDGTLKINKSQIARELEVDRRTVDKYINGYTKPETRNCDDCITPFYDIITELLSDKNQQVFYYRKVLWQYLVDNHGFKGVYCNFCHYQCHLDKVFYDENSISYAVMHCKYSSVKKCRIY